MFIELSMQEREQLLEDLEAVLDSGCAQGRDPVLLRELRSFLISEGARRLRWSADEGEVREGAG